MQTGEVPHHHRSPVMADEQRVVGTDLVEQADEVGAQVVGPVGLDRARCARLAVPALVGYEHPVPGCDERFDLVAPRVRTLGEPVHQHHDRITGSSGIDHIELDAVRGEAAA